MMSVPVTAMAAAGTPFAKVVFGVSDQNNPEMVASQNFKNLHASSSRIIVPWHSGLDYDNAYYNRRRQMKDLCNASWKNGVRPQIAFNPADAKSPYPRIPDVSNLAAFRMSLSNIADDCDNNNDKAGGVYKTADIEVFNEPDLAAPSRSIDIARMWIVAETFMQKRRGGGKVSAFSLALSGQREWARGKSTSWYRFSTSFLKHIRDSNINPDGLRPTAISLHPYNDINANTKRVSLVMRRLFRNNKLYPTNATRSNNNQLPALWLTEASVYHARQSSCYSKSNKGLDALGNPMINNRQLWVSQAAYNQVHASGAVAKAAEFACWLSFPKKYNKKGKAVEQWVFKPTVVSKQIFANSFAPSEAERAQHFVSLVNEAWSSFGITRIYWYEWANTHCRRLDAHDFFGSPPVGTISTTDENAMGLASPTRTPGNPSGGCGDNGRAAWHSGLFDTNVFQPLPSLTIIRNARS